MKLIIANWKLNPTTIAEAKELASKIKKKSRNIVVLCPPAPFLGFVKYPLLGAQDVFWMPKGPYTGQVSPLTLKSLGVQYCIVGHSENRTVGETDEQINLKIKTLLQNKITPVLCIGFNTTVEEDDLEVIDILKDQVAKALKDVNAKKIVVAYEPVWAISSGKNFEDHKVPTPEHAEKIAMFLKNKFGVKHILYGGSVNPENAEGYLSQRSIDGLLIGGASLIPDDFNKIISL